MGKSYPFPDRRKRMGVLSILSFLWLPSTLPTLYLSSFLPAVLELVGHKHIHYPLWSLSFLRLVATCLGLSRCSINIFSIVP